MCGIAGLFDHQKKASQHSALEHVCQAMVHRGPDAQSIRQFTLEAGNLSLAHRRLAIIDLSPAGTQPMCVSSGSYWITYNGEIYNFESLRTELSEKGYVFSTDTDTETLLIAYQEWGEACLTKLVGMFAFVIFDAEKQTLFCARDGFGIKPFFYTLDEGCFYFASESHQIPKLSGKSSHADLQIISDYLMAGRYDSSRQTMISGVQQLRAGECLTLSLLDITGKEQPERWWHVGLAEVKRLSFEEAAQKFKMLFLESVEAHLRSDVPVGVALSGGLDSSAIACAVRHVAPELKLHTYSYISDEKRSNEEKWVDIINQEIGAVAHKVYIDKDQLDRELDHLVHFQGEPFGSTSIFASYAVFKRAGEDGIKVMLEGQGADELLAGYLGYPGSYSRSLLERGDFKKLMTFWQSWVQRSDRTFSILMYQLAQEFLPQEATEFVRNHTVKRRLARWIDQNWLKQHDVDTSKLFKRIRKTDGRKRRLVEHMRNVACYDGLHHLLRHGDRNAMASSIENRVPFLTPALAEFVYSLPEDYLIGQDGVTKKLLRAAMRGIVPDAVLDRQDKIGFETPQRSWLLSNAALVSEAIQQLPEKAMLRRDALLDEFSKNGLQHIDLDLTWRLVNLAKWSSIHDISLSDS